MLGSAGWFWPIVFTVPIVAISQKNRPAEQALYVLKDDQSTSKWRDSKKNK
jgi:hypothetical protein